MYKTLAFIIGLVAASTVLAQAQQQPIPVIPLAILAQCSTKQVAMDLVGKWQEIPFVSAQSRSQLAPQGQPLNGNIKMYVNPTTWSWSLFLTDPDEELWCLLSSGEGLSVGEGGDPT